MGLDRTVTRNTVRQLTRALPTPVLLRLVRNRPWLSERVWPENRVLRFDGYLNEFTVDVDTRFPIERTMLSGTYEPESISVIRRMVPRGGTCFDVGANIGALTLAMAQRVGPAGRVFAFEPGPSPRARLMANLALNPRLAEIVSVHDVALSDREQELKWREEEHNPGNASCLNEAGEMVHAEAIDRLVSRLGIRRLDFVKIDVEGMEVEVIRGGADTWRRLRPAIYYETMPRFEMQRKLPLFTMIAECLRGLGYRLFSVMHGMRREVIAAPRSKNTPAVPEEALL